MIKQWELSIIFLEGEGVMIMEGFWISFLRATHVVMISLEFHELERGLSLLDVGSWIS